MTGVQTCALPISSTAKALRTAPTAASDLARCVTPHQAGLTHRAKSDAAVGAVHNALAVLAGDIPPNLVNTLHKPAGTI